MQRFIPLVRFLLAGAVITVIFVTIYAAVQQDLRQSANDPQIQLAEDAARALSVGAAPASLMPADRHVIDASKSLAPFVMVFDDRGTVLESSMRAGNELPMPPVGVFDYVRAHGEDRVTWQTASGLRFAAIIVPWQASSTSGFVLAARSLREAEKREGNLELTVGVAWLFSLIMTLFRAIFARY